jgi:dynein heavy chain, axonemal
MYLEPIFSSGDIG